MREHNEYYFTIFREGTPTARPLAHPTSRSALGEAGALLFSRTPIARVAKKDSLAAVEETGRK